jgi:hypothetical protein
VSDAVRACLRGCVIRAQHLSECQDSACTGCLWRPATIGELCIGCHGRPVRALAELGDLADWIRQNVEPGTRRDPGDVNAVDEAWAPLSIEALTDLDALATMVSGWARIAVEEHPDHLHGPDWRGMRIVPNSKRTLAWGEVVYEEARIVGVRAGNEGAVIAAAAGWMISFSEWFAAQPWADDWHDDLVAGARAANKKWPRTPSRRKAPLPCPSCDLISLWWNPASEFKADATVTCHNDECGRVLTESDYWVQVMSRRNAHAAGKRSA